MFYGESLACATVERQALACTLVELRSQRPRERAFAQGPSSAPLRPYAHPRPASRQVAAHFDLSRRGRRPPCRARPGRATLLQPTQVRCGGYAVAPSSVGLASSRPATLLSTSRSRLRPPVGCVSGRLCVPAAGGALGGCASGRRCLGRWRQAPGAGSVASAARDHSAADTASPPSAGCQTISPASFWTHSPSAHSSP